jgi:hypothetical protein
MDSLVTTYTYQGSGVDEVEREEKDRRREWLAYEKKNARANARYVFHDMTIDARYDPKGGGPRVGHRRGGKT